MMAEKYKDHQKYKHETKQRYTRREITLNEHHTNTNSKLSL